MGTLDFLKGVKDHVIDAATYDLLLRTYELQEENHHQLKEKIAFLEEKITGLTKENASLTAEVKKLSLLAHDDNFEIHSGFAFRKGPDGKFAEEAYCPNCKAVLGNPAVNMYACPKCKFTKRYRGGGPSYIAIDLNKGIATTTPREAQRQADT